MVLVILTVVWSAYGFLWWRNRDETRPGQSIVTFTQHLEVLGRTMGSTQDPDHGFVRVQPVQDGAAIARRRRREVLRMLVAAVGATLPLALLFGGVFVALHLLVDLLLGGYVALLVRMRQLAAERDEKVIELPKYNEERELLLTRSGS